MYTYSLQMIYHFRIELKHHYYMGFIALQKVNKTEALTLPIVCV